MNEYAIYLRKSRKDIELENIEKFETLAKHENELKELAAKQGLKIGKIYREVVSGESIDDRPEMQQLLDDIYMRKWKGVLVKEVERLARGNTKEQGIVAEAFQYTNTLIITPIKTYDPQNEYDEEYFEFGLFMSRREYKTIRRRMQSGLIASIKDGNYLGSIAPYGYDKITIDKKTKTLKFNDETEIVKMMFDWFVNDNMSCGEIARKLTEMKIKTRSGKKEWNRATIKDILKNDIYTGKIRWNRRKCTKEFDGEMMKKVKKRRDHSEYILVSGKHPALVSQEMFDKAQERLKAQNPVNADAQLVNPFAGLIVCSKCKKPFTLQMYHTKTNVKPRLIHAESMICKMKSITYDDFLESFINSMNSFIEDFEMKLSDDALNARISDYETLLKNMNKNLDDLKKRRTEIFEYLESGIYTQDEFIERKEAILKEIDDLKHAIKEQEKNQPAKIDYKEKAVKFSYVLETLQDDSISAKIKNGLLKDIIKNIEITVNDLGRQKGYTFTLDIFLR